MKKERKEEGEKKLGLLYYSRRMIFEPVGFSRVF
jgi:hypothetical protein